MDFETSLRRAIKTGAVKKGQNATKKSIESGAAEMVVMAENCPEEFRTYLEGKEGLFIHIYKGSSMALGKSCGQPYMVSALAIESAGESDILTLKRA